ncbi:hypothetical protein LO762_27550 [Actinocorallia sp. API 0066]|uniref:hypothetical protein n=1 Tax=Actinocorallia sp. API 0066 TaxID=2896846 RepID=UPI001E51119C|nr:hypothetical protein [Actinocorallia sp. API 0066]MCD0452907.1 hypothetical protein [Actinocorallia sp. API 0066]
MSEFLVRVLAAALAVLFLAACGTPTRDSASAGDGADPTPGPSVSDPCGADIGGDDVPPVCVSSDPVPTGVRTTSEAPCSKDVPTLCNGPVRPEWGDGQPAFTVTVSGPGGVYVESGAAASEPSLCSGTCEYVATSTTLPVTFTPEPGHHLHNPKTGTPTWPFPCLAQSGDVPCTTLASTLADQSLHFTTSPNTTPTPGPGTPEPTTSAATTPTPETTP